MKHYRISQLARMAGLSRSTLLHYDRIGLLSPSGRTAAGYRVYDEKDRKRLGQICQYRAAGLALADVARLLEARGRNGARLLENRLQSMSEEMGALRAQRQLLTQMLQRITGKGRPATVNKELWVSMLRAAGVSEESMKRWHSEFERRAPQGHQEFLVSLGLGSAEIARIRASSGGNPTP